MTGWMLSTLRLEHCILLGLCLGLLFIVWASRMGSWAQTRGGRAAKAVIELRRKSFHMLGGCILVAAFHFGLQSGILSPAYLGDSQTMPGAWMSSHAFLLATMFSTWSLEFARLTFPSVNAWYLRSFRGVVREKEFGKASGVAYFIPGCLAAAMAGPSDVAVLGMLCLSLGDAASSLGTALGCVPVGASSRKLEGSLACFVVCLSLACYTGLPLQQGAVTSAVVTLGEVMAEVIGVDDNLVLPMLTVVAVRVSFHPEFAKIFAAMVSTLSVGIGLGVVVACATPTSESSGKIK